MSNAHEDWNLLLGVLAVEMNFIERDQLMTAAAEWMKDEAKPLDEILVERGWLMPDEVRLLQELTQHHLKRHGNDLMSSLNATNSFADISSELEESQSAFGKTIDHSSGAKEGLEPDAVSWATDQYVASEDERFLVLRPHARGGLGKISVALDRQLNREVALKELLNQNAEDPAKRARFMLEAEITGGLEHPGIVAVYALGQRKDMRPYYAMRLIHGCSLQEVIERFHDATVDASRSENQSMELRRLLRSFVDVCNAVAYAHSRGVLHRDLKPANIMLGKYGETFVVDWGLAKASQEVSDVANIDEPVVQPMSGSGSAGTQMGSAFGTPHYMAPEQAAGRLDLMGPASDVYSLGATLFSLLTGHRPIGGNELTEVLRKVQQGNIRPPRDINANVPRPLDAVCSKAMSFKSEDRYSSPSALADDIDHWLADESVSAYAESWIERAGRCTRRHRTWTQAAAATLIVVAVVASAAVVLVNRARREEVRQRGIAEVAERESRKLAQDNQSLAELERTARQEAMKRLHEARQAVDTWHTGVAEALKYYPGVQEARGRLLAKAAEDYERFTQQVSDNEELELERGRAYVRLGDVRRVLRDLEKAEAAYSSARSVFEKYSREDPSAAIFRLELANSDTKSGLVAAERGDLAGAEKRHASAIHANRSLVETDPQEPRYRYALGTALVNQASLYIQTSRLVGARELLLQAIDELDQAVSGASGERSYLVGLLTAQNLLGQTFSIEGRYDEAMARFRRALAGFEALLQEYRDDPQLLASQAATRIYLASVARNLGQLETEHTAYQAAIKDYTALAEAMPDVPLYQENLALTQTDLAQLLQEQGRTKPAKQNLKKSLPIFARLRALYPNVPRYHEEHAAAQVALGRVLGDRGRNREANTNLEQALATYEQLRQAIPDELQYAERSGVTSSYLGQLYQKLGDEDAALESFRQALETLNELAKRAPDIPAYRNEAAFAHRYRGELLYDGDQALEAAHEFREAFRLWEELSSRSGSPTYAYHAAWLLANCVDPQMRDAVRAVKFAQLAVDDAPRNGQYHNGLGVAYYRTGDWQTAIKHLEHAIELRGVGHGLDWFFLSMAQRQLGQIDEAGKNHQRAERWMTENQPDNVELKRIRDEARSVLQDNASINGTDENKE